MAPSTFSKWIMSSLFLIYYWVYYNNNNNNNNKDCQTVEELYFQLTGGVRWVNSMQQDERGKNTANLVW